MTAPEPIKVTVSDPATGEVLGEQIIENDYIVICAGGRFPGSVRVRQAADELDRLRRWKAEAIAVLDEWERLHIALGSPGRLGGSKAAASLAEMQRRIVAAAAPSTREQQ